MKKLLLFSLLVISCTSQPIVQEIVVHDFAVDFPITDTVKYREVQSFDIVPDVYTIIVKDTVLFVEEYLPDNLGHCYSINSKKQLSTLVGRGNAANEINSTATIETLGSDSIAFYNANTQTIKAFSVEDIVTKKMGDRPFSIFQIPTEIISRNFHKINEKKILGSFYMRNKDGYRYYIYDGKNVSPFGKYGNNIFEDSTKVNDSTFELISFPSFCHYGDKVATVNYVGCLLQVIDTEKQIIEKERCYHKIKLDENGAPDLNNDKFYPGYITCDQQYIYCQIVEPDKVKSKESGRSISNIYILVFDWDLNPIKRYYLGEFDMILNRFHLSQDGKRFYYMTLSEEHSVKTLYDCIME